VSGGGHDDGLPEEHEEHTNHEAWVIPYADLLTLLMAMFIALFAMSTVDMSKFKALAIGFNEALNGPNLDKGVLSPTSGSNAVDMSGGGSGIATNLKGGAVGPDKQPNTNAYLASLADQNANLQAAKSAEQQTFKHIQSKIQTQAKKLGFAGDLNLRLEERGLVVTVVTDQVLFDSGSAVLKTNGVNVLQLVGESLKTINNPILIEGHTDSTPISTPQYPSNWELSSGRAGSVARYFESLGLDRARLRPEGLADNFPVASNATAAGRARNRRVEIVVQSNLVNQALENAGLSNKPATTTTTSPIGTPVPTDLGTDVTAH
jgi:chemotaxis protein MotB